MRRTARRPTSRTAHWWVMPLVIPRWMLTAKYVGFTVLGLIVFVGGLPTINFVTSEGYRPVWALMVSASAAVAAVLSVHPHWEPGERWAAVALTAWLAVYLVAVIIRAWEAGGESHGRWAGVVVVAMITMLPAVRATSLLFQTGKPRTELPRVQ